MAVRVSRYLEPGVFIQEQPVQTIPAFVGLPRQICLIGEGDHCETVVNERHLRAYITQEAITPNAQGVFFTAHTSDWKKTTMFLFKDGDQQDDASFVLTPPAALTAGAPSAGGSVDDGTHSYKVTFVINGKETAAGATSNVVTTGGGNNTVPLSAVPVGPTGTTSRKIYRTKANATTYFHVPGLDATFNNNSTTSGTDTFSDASLTTVAPTTGIVVAQIGVLFFDPASTYTFSYQSLSADNPLDKLAAEVRDECGQILSVGSFPDTKNFVEGDDYTLKQTGTGTITSVGTAVTGSGTLFSQELVAGDAIIANNQLRIVVSITTNTALTIDTPFTPDISVATPYTFIDGNLKWLPPTAGSITGSKGEPFDFTVNGGLPKTFRVTIDGGVEQVVTFVSADFVLPAAATAAEVQTKLSASLTGESITTLAGHIVVSSASTGPNSTIQIGGGDANVVLGFVTGAFNRGKGKNPAQGEEYFVSYKAQRPDSDFNRPILSTSLDQFIAKVGPVSSVNALAIAGQIVFEQNPPFVFHVQVKNTGTGAAAQDIDYTDAIKGAELNADLTDIVVLGHPTLNAGGKKALVRAALRDHVINESSLQNRAERIGWFGMAVGTPPGDGETPGTFVYVATNELQVSADSPGRGRFILNGPSFIRKTYRFPDGSVKQLTLDSTYLAAGVAALEGSFLSPAEGLLRKEVVGLDEVQELSKGDRDFMASNGVNLVVSRNGINVVFDPVTTDQTSAEFREINVMAQKDNVVKRVRKQVDDTIVGLVPDDLAQFVFEVKSTIAVVLNSAIADGAIAPFQNSDGSIRNIDLASDIIVRRRASDPTTYDFQFTFFVKFIAKRLFGTFSVQVPSGT